MRVLAAAALVLATVACSMQGGVREGYYSGLRPLGEAHAEALSTSGWMNPKTLQIHGASDLPEEGDLVLRGVIIGYHFRSVGDLEGQISAPPVPGRCRKVALMLRDRRLVDVDQDRPAGEYLVGLFDPETELFHPTLRTVVRPEAPEAPVTPVAPVTPS